MTALVLNTPHLEALARDVAGAWADVATSSARVKTHAKDIAQLVTKGPEKIGQQRTADAVAAVTRLRVSRDELTTSLQAFKAAIDDARIAAGAIGDPGAAAPVLAAIDDVERAGSQDPRVTTSGMLAGAGWVGAGGGAAGWFMTEFAAQALLNAHAGAVAQTVGLVAGTAGGLYAGLGGRSARTLPHASAVDDLARLATGAARDGVTTRRSGDVPVRRLVSAVGEQGAKVAAERSTAVGVLAGDVTSSLDAAVAEAHDIERNGDHLSQAIATETALARAAAADRRELLGLVKPAEIAPATSVSAAEQLASTEPAHVAMTA